MTENTAGTTLSTIDQEAILAAIADIKQRLPFLIDLTRDDRKAMPKLGDKSRAFVKKALDVAVQNPGVLPASFDLNKMRNDAQLFDHLTPIKLALDQLQKQVNDTAIGIGSQAYTAARDVYASTKSRFARAALETATGDLGQRFARKTRAAAAGGAPAKLTTSATATRET
jgi:hypothetical protein